MSILKTQTKITACDEKHGIVFSHQEVSVVYVVAKTACGFIQVDMNSIEVAYSSQWNIGMSYNDSCYENRPHAITSVYYQMMK